MYPAPCSPSSSIFSEMFELHETRNSSKRDYSEKEQLSVGSSYDAAKSSPVFFGRYGHKVSDSVAEIREGEDGMSTRSSLYPEFDPSINHPATFGYVLMDRKPTPPKQESPTLPDPKECSPREYLEAYMFPVLLPAIEQMLIAANYKENEVFERRRTKFNACDFLTEYLFRNNPKFKDRSNVTLEDIPFVQTILAENPRPPLPLSLLLSDEEAAIIIQSFYRGYLMQAHISLSLPLYITQPALPNKWIELVKGLALLAERVRKRPDVQELREYQKEMRHEAVDIFLKAEDFSKKHPVEEEDEEEKKTEKKKKRGRVQRVHSNVIK